jgi:hypothetical protein
VAQRSSRSREATRTAFFRQLEFLAHVVKAVGLSQFDHKADIGMKYLSPCLSMTFFIAVTGSVNWWVCCSAG